MKQTHTLPLDQAYAELEAYNQKFITSKRTNMKEDADVTTIIVPPSKKTLMSNRSTSGGMSFGVKNPDADRPRSHFLYEFTKHPVGDWASWSMCPHTSDEIRSRLLTKPIDATCISYLCRFSKIDPEFLDEFIILSTGYFHDVVRSSNDMMIAQPIRYDENSLAYYKTLLDWELSDKKNPKPVMPDFIKEQLPKYALGHFNYVTDKIDWFYIAYWQRFPYDVWNRYSKRAGLQAAKAENQSPLFNE